MKLNLFIVNGEKDSFVVAAKNVDKVVELISLDKKFKYCFFSFKEIDGKMYHMFDSSKIIENTIKISDYSIEGDKEAIISYCPATDEFEYATTILVK